MIQNSSNIHKPNFDKFLFVDMFRSNAGLYTVWPKQISSIFSSCLTVRRRPEGLYVLPLNLLVI